MKRKKKKMKVMNIKKEVKDIFEFSLEDLRMDGYEEEKKIKENIEVQ